jgi:hypothetical protein
MQSMLFRGYDAAVCPIIGEIQMFEKLNNTEVNNTFENYRKNLYPLLQQKFNISGDPLDLPTANEIIDEVLTNR